MRPTASSASKVHDKSEVKSPPKRTPSVIRPKGTVKPKPTKVEKAAPERTNGDKMVKDAETEAADTAGASTPQTASGAQEQETGSAGLDATPAFDTATIR